MQIFECSRISQAPGCHQLISLKDSARCTQNSFYFFISVCCLGINFQRLCYFLVVRLWLQLHSRDNNAVISVVVSTVVCSGVVNFTIIVGFIGNDEVKLVPMGWYRVAPGHFVKRVAWKPNVSNNHVVVAAKSKKTLAIANHFFYSILPNAPEPAFTVVTNSSI